MKSKCSRHPTYKAIRAPRAKCRACSEMWGQVLLREAKSVLWLILKEIKKQTSLMQQTRAISHKESVEYKKSQRAYRDSLGKPGR